MREGCQPCAFGLFLGKVYIVYYSAGRCYIIIMCEVFFCVKTYGCQLEWSRAFPAIVWKHELRIMNYEIRITDPEPRTPTPKKRDSKGIKSL